MADALSPSAAAQDDLDTESAAMEALVERLVDEMNERWSSGEGPCVEELLARHPAIGLRPEAAVELIYEEVCLRRSKAIGPTPSELFRRFPQWRTQIEMLLDCQQLLEDAAVPRFPEIGEVLGGFRLLAELGRGARGRVFLASQPALADRAVVLKLAAAAAEGNEHLSLARLQHTHNTHIVPLFGVEEFPERNLRALCMPYFGGTTFEGLFAALGSCPPALRHGRDVFAALRRLELSTPAVDGPAEVEAERHQSAEGPACRIIAQLPYAEAMCWLAAYLADALHYADQRGLVHLDIKPSNVLLAADGLPMLLDFHLARPPLSKGAAAPEFLGGTPAYMAPEQALAIEAVRTGTTLPAAVDGRADIYSLGLLLFEALAGLLPPPDVEDQASWLRARNPRVSVGLADLVARCARHETCERYRDASLLADDLRRHLKNEPLRGVPNRSLPERWRKWRRRRPHALTLATLLAVGVGVAAQASMHFRQQRQKAELALDEGHDELERRDYIGALSASRRGLELVEGLPFAGALTDALRQQHVQARRAHLAGELHRVVDHLRATTGADVLTVAQGRDIEGHCRHLWDERHVIVARLAGQPLADLERQIEIDLVDLAILWTDLRVRMAGGDEISAARRDALAILDQAESLAGPSTVVELERQVHQTALGWDEALGQAERRTAALAPHTAWEHYAVGRALLRSGKLDEAAERFESAVALEPQGLWPNFYAGKCAYERGRYVDATIAFTACAALAPDSPWCFYNRGLAFERQGNSERARRDFDRAMRLDPGLARTIENRANSAPDLPASSR
jgi:serine/threonine protein kinase/tetratricopeptide (TPR) repeat protein